MYVSSGVAYFDSCLIWGNKGKTSTAIYGSDGASVVWLAILVGGFAELAYPHVPDLGQHGQDQHGGVRLGRCVGIEVGRGWQGCPATGYLVMLVDDSARTD